MTPPLPPLRLLTAFAAVAGTGSIQAAAARLNVSQPAISQAVKQLEDHVGVPLLDRGRRPARLTEAGETLATAILLGLGQIGDALDAVRLAGPGHDGTVTLACSVGVATYWLMPQLTAFYRAHPDFLVNVMTTPTGAPPLAEGIDLAVRFGHGRWTDGKVHLLFPECIEPVCAPALRARHGAAVAPSGVSLLHVRAAEPSWLSWPDYLRATGQAPVQREGQVFTNYVQATQAALEGHGMLLGWRSITGALCASGQLVTAGLPRLTPPDGFFLVARNKRRGQASEVFAQWLLARAAAPA